MSELRLKNGMHVEVMSDEEGFRGAWYVAKVIQTPKLMENFVHVEYNEFVSEEDESKKLTERVPVSFVRPLPPVGKGYNEVIEVNDVVDAFYNDGWWTGVVDQVMDDGRKVEVSFDDPPNSMVFKGSDVRVHFDWVDGKWEKPLEKQASGRHLMRSNHSGNSRRQKRKASKRQHTPKCCASTEKKDDMDDEIVPEEVDMSVKEIGDAVPTNNCETPPNKDQKNKNKDGERLTVDSTTVSTKGERGLKRRRGRPKLLSKNKTGERSTIAKDSTQKRVTKDSCVVDEAEITAEKNRLLLTTVDKPNKDHFQPLSKDSMMVTTNEQHTSGVCRHNALCSETAIIPFLEDQEDEIVLIKRLKWHKHSLSSEPTEMSKIVDSESQCQVYQSKDANMPIDGIYADEDQVSNTRVQLNKPSPTDADDFRSLPVQRQCANANSIEDDFGTPIAKKDRIEPGPPQKTDGSNPGDLHAKSLSRADSNDKGGEDGTPAASVCVDNVENNQSLPFLKRSPLWKYIESMEILKKTTKKPHFSPLVKCKEDTREGLAIGHMVNFSNLVENMSQIQFSHPITIIESKLEILAELEPHGFDVETVQECLTQLLSKKQREEEFQKEYQDIENEISHSVEEISKVDEEVAELNKKMKEILAKLGDTVSRKEMKESMISTLKSEQKVVGENLSRLQTDFENIAGSVV